MITDFITGQRLPNEGAEANRQAVERHLIRRKAYQPVDIDVNCPITVTIAEETYRSRIDLAVHIDERIVMAIKCAAGSLESRQREIIAAARLLTNYQIPLSVVTDGQTAFVYDTVNGKKIGIGIEAIPHRKEAVRLAEATDFIPYPENRREREAIIFRSYDTMNINVTRNG
jgi:predicted type IV restriction endonuclease